MRFIAPASFLRFDQKILFVRARRTARANENQTGNARFGSRLRHGQKSTEAFAPVAKSEALRAGGFGRDVKNRRRKFDESDKAKEIVLQRGLAEEFSFCRTFCLRQPFDMIFISYSLSMFPKWRDAIGCALENLKAECELFIVDFWDGGWFNRLRKWWLALFGVHYRPEFLEFLKELEMGGAGKYTVTPVGCSYAFIAHFRKS